MKKFLALLAMLVGSAVSAQQLDVTTIPNLPPLIAPLGSGDYVICYQSGAKKCTVAQLDAQVVSGLAPSATIDTTNASNINKGTLPCTVLSPLVGAITSTNCDTIFSPGSFVSPDGSITITGVPGSIVSLSVDLANVTGSVPITALPALTGNGVQMVQAIGNVSSMCGLPFIDGVNGTDGNDVLLAHQNTAPQNGPWRMHAGSCPGAGNWTRPPWFQSGSTTQAVNNMSILVAPSGVDYGSSTWTLQFAPTPVIIDTTSQSWFVSQPKSVSILGGLIGRNGGQRAGDSANVAEYGSWGGAIRKDYGNSNAVSGISCTQGNTTIGLANVTIPSNYNGAGAEVPGCADPGAINSVNPGSRAASFTFADSGTGYVPQQILSCAGGTPNVACEVVVYSTIMTALPTVTSGGSGCTPGTQTFTGVSGIAYPGGTNYFTVTGTVNGGGVLQSPLTSFVANGPYSAAPINAAAEPVSGGGCVVQPTLNLLGSMGANTGSVYVAGDYTTIPSNPVAFTPMALPISTMVWQSGGGGTVTVTICTYAAGCVATLPGWMYPNWTTGTSTFPVTISGASPSGYNGTYTATVIGPNAFQFTLVSNPGTTTEVGSYTISPTATGADANLFWYGNPLVGTISNIVNSGGSATFTMSIPANSTLNDGGGKVYLWRSLDDAAFSTATSLGAQTVIVPDPQVIPGWESGYMISSGITLGGTHRWAFDGMGGFISGADHAGSPVSGAMLTISNSGAFRGQATSTIVRLDLDAAGGFERQLTNADWDWVVCGDLFENATAINIAWSYGGHSRESLLCDSHIINDGYNPLTFPVIGIDSEAPDTRIKDMLIMEGFQQTALFNNASTGDVNISNVHAEEVVAGPIFSEKGAGNRYLDGNQADAPAPGYPGFAFYNGFNTLTASDTILSGSWAGQIGILVDVNSQHGTFVGGTFNRGGIPAAYACIDQSSGGLSTNGNKNTWIANIGCAQIPIGIPTYIVATLPSCTAAINLYSLASVTDAVSPTYNSTLTGNGTVKIPVFCNGTNWVAH